MTRSQVQARMAAERTAAELRQSEQALQGANQQIGTILESITDAFVAFDREWHYTYVNDAAEQLLHRTREDLLGKHIWDEVFPQAKGEIFYRELHRAVAEQVSIALEAFSKTLNCWLEIHAYPSTEGLAVYFRDVTNFRQAEKERERFFTLSMDMLCTANFDGYFTRINPAFERILGYTSAELLSKPFFELVHPEDLEKTIAELQKLATGQPTLYFENRYCCQDGSYKWLAWTSSPVIEEELTYAVARDITEQRQAEEFLRQTNERLKLLSETASDLLLNEQPQEFINSLFQKLSVISDLKCTSIT